MIASPKRPRTFVACAPVKKVWLPLESYCVTGALPFIVLLKDLLFREAILQKEMALVESLYTVKSFQMKTLKETMTAVSF